MPKGGDVMRLCLIILLLCILVPTVGFGGLVIEEKLTTRGMMGMMDASGKETTYIEGDKIRTESRMKHGGMMAGMMKQSVLPQVTIIRLDKNLVWNVNDDDSTFMEVSLEETGGAEQPKGVSFKIKDVKVTDIDKQKKIAGHDCKGLKMEMIFETQAEDQKTEQSAEILFWMAPETGKLKGMKKAWERMMESVDESGDMLKGAMEEISAKVKERKGVPLGMEMVLEMSMPAEAEEDEMKEAMQAMRQFMKAKEPAEGAPAEEQLPANQLKVTREVISITEQKLEKRLFEVPASYTKTR
jgi:hypothetical protein